ncbi:MAG: chromate resistance protein ChrB domain-containing protein [Nitrospinota bacterium]
MIHHIPPKPAYFRVRIWRRLQGLGAVAIKNSVYALPRSEQTLEDFQWVVREIIQGGGEATLCEAHLVEGLTDEQLQALFQAARDADYARLAREARALLASLPRDTGREDQRAEAALQWQRLRKRFAEMIAVDYLGASGREGAEGAISALEDALQAPSREAAPAGGAWRERLRQLGELRGRTWVTRQGVFVDRIASAWLIRRFIDPGARFRFVSPKIYPPGPGEIRFDMFEAEFTHEGDLCTFEVLLECSGLDDPALRSIAALVHDMDIKDGKFQREETPGLLCLLEGIVTAHRGDPARLERGGAVFDDLYAYFRRKRPARE